MSAGGGLSEWGFLRECRQIAPSFGIPNVCWNSHVGAHSRAPWPPVPAQFSPAQTGAHGCAPLRGGAKQTIRVRYHAHAGNTRTPGCSTSSLSHRGRVRVGAYPRPAAQDSSTATNGRATGECQRPGPFDYLSESGFSGLKDSQDLTSSSVREVVDARSSPPP